MKRPESKNLCQNLSQNSLIQRSITATKKTEEDEEEEKHERTTGNFGETTRIRDRRAASPLYSGDEDVIIGNNSVHSSPEQIHGSSLRRVL